MSSNKGRILIVIPNPRVNSLMKSILLSSGYDVSFSDDYETAIKAIAETSPTLVITSELNSNGNETSFAEEALRRFPGLPVILFIEQDSPEMVKRAIRLGVSDYLCPPLRVEDILNSVENSHTKSDRMRKWVLLEAKRATASLQRKVDELETLTRLGHSINGSLDLDSVLSKIVEAAVELTGAEEGSLLLLDEDTGELYMRASRNFQEEFARTFRLPVNDTLAGSVLSTGQPVLLDESSPLKIKTSYLVHSLVYVPLMVDEKVIGVLGVDNRSRNLPFKQRDVKLLSAISEYAVVAVENAGLHQLTIQERNKLDTIINRIQDGVIVMDQEQRLLLVNQAARAVFSLGEEEINGRLFQEVIDHPDMLTLVEGAGKNMTNWLEINVDSGRVYSVQLTPIPNIGQAITMYDITYLKKLDAIKTDFVNTVSHDLRSPLTAIMGYVDLIERTGPVTDMQRDFIHRVQLSVHNISTLVDDLLRLGRIEADADSRKDDVYLDQLISYVGEQLAERFDQQKQYFVFDRPQSFPPVKANPMQMQSLIENLLDNAIKYTPEGGTITVNAKVEKKQVVLQICDNGIGIPALDLPYIFDKFYRASNVDSDVIGTGLGLSIVKSVVENHQGRIWVDSKQGQGTTFSVVLPLVEEKEN